MYYYRRKSNPLKWLIVIAIILAIAGFGYWYYVNYFSKIDFSKPEAADENLNQPIEPAQKILAAGILSVQGDVQASLNNAVYGAVLPDMILHQGDKVKTGLRSNAVIKLENNSLIRLGENTEVILQNLAENNVLLEQIKGRIYQNLPADSQYKIKFSDLSAEAFGGKFEVIANSEKKYAAVLVFANTVKVEIAPNQKMVLAASLDTAEKALIDLQAAKKDQLKIENFEVKALAKEPWYKWNFDLDSGLAEKLVEEEPDFATTADSLELAVVKKDSGVYLSWSIYNLEDFKNYQIVRSETKADLKYPDTEAIKSSADKNLNTFLDAKAENGKKYYYRICVLKINDKVVCGNVANIELAPEEKDMIAPAMPLLSANVSADGVSLNWTANNEDDLKEYRVLKSLTDSNLNMPSIGYLAIRSKGQERYLDPTVDITSVGFAYYRVCSLDTAGNSACSNVVTIENGKVK